MKIQRNESPTHCRVAGKITTTVFKVTSTAALASAVTFFTASGMTRAQTLEATTAPISFRVRATSVESLRAAEIRVFDLINHQREENGVRPLLWTEKAAAVARIHSDNMAQLGFFRHEDLDGRMVSERADRNGLSKWRQIGENIAWISGYDDPAARAVEGWMKSPGHRRNILDPKYSETGIGLSVAGSGRVYFTQVFVSPQ